MPILVGDNSPGQASFSPGETVEIPASATLKRLMLWTIFAILIILWLLGWGFHVAGGFIHLLLVVALIVAVINLVSGRKTV